MILTILWFYFNLYNLNMKEDIFQIVFNWKKQSQPFVYVKEQDSKQKYPEQAASGLKLSSVDQQRLLKSQNTQTSWRATR